MVAIAVMVAVAATVIAVTIVVTVAPAVVTVMVAIAPAVGPAIPVTIPISVAVTPILAAIPAAIGPNKAARVLPHFFTYSRVTRQELAEFGMLSQVKRINRQARVLVQVPLNRRVRIQETIEIAQLGAGNIAIGHLPPSRRRKCSAQDNGQEHEAKIFPEHSYLPRTLRLPPNSEYIGGNPPHPAKFRAAAERFRRIFPDREATFFIHVRRVNVLLHL